MASWSPTFQGGQVQDQELFFFPQENKLGSSLLVAKIAEEKAVSCKSVYEIL